MYTRYKIQQKNMLHDVRNTVPDDVPYLVFSHNFGNTYAQVVDKMYSTALLIPYYHNQVTGLRSGSAQTSAGVLSAIEWLIPLAQRQ
jgi:radical SAM superfamily enzyme